MKKHLYLVFILTILLISWDMNKQDFALASGNNLIPDEAIRLRIIANSDSIEDQILKRKVRDKIIEHIDPMVYTVADIDEARGIIKKQLPEIEKIVNKTVKESGLVYSLEPKVDFGLVPFPTKMYGDKVYPAGEYEALRVTIGNGEGQNWWCVLFPPLCFVDMTTADAVDANANVKVENSSQASKNVEVKFFLLEILENIVVLLKSIF